MIEDRRVYITGSSSRINTQMANNVPRQFLVNEGKTECLQYNLGSRKNDQIYSVRNFQGSADLYLARKNKPSSKYSGAVTHLSESLYPQQSFIVTIVDREYW